MKYVIAFSFGVGIVLILTGWAEIISWAITHLSKRTMVLCWAAVAGILFMILLRLFDPPKTL